MRGRDSLNIFRPKSPGMRILSRGSQSWEHYWANQSEVLFFGLYADIADGKMPNRKTGSSDYLTVSGDAGSETYQCPNTAAYIAADTDYIWFKTDETQRTVTTGELIGYDLQKTPVKYEDESPNEIVAIVILSASVTGVKRDKLFQDMWLHTLWDNNLNGYGHIKDNKVVQTLWIPEAPAIVSDGNTVAWYIANNIDDITADGSNYVSQWRDHLGSGVNLAQSVDDKKPLWSATGILFDGSNDFMATSGITYNQPIFVYLVCRQKTWTLNDTFFAGVGGKYVGIYQSASSPNIIAYGGTSNSSENTNLPIDSFAIIRVLFSGASSKLIVNATTATTGNWGTGAIGGITLGRSNGSDAQYGNIEFKELLFRKKADAAGDENDIYTYLKKKYSL